MDTISWYAINALSGSASDLDKPSASGKLPRENSAVPLPVVAGFRSHDQKPVTAQRTIMIRKDFNKAFIILEFDLTIEIVRYITGVYRKKYAEKSNCLARQLFPDLRPGIPQRNGTIENKIAFS
jgi:hypothetical protein